MKKMKKFLIGILAASCLFIGCGSTETSYYDIESESADYSSDEVATEGFESAYSDDYDASGATELANDDITSSSTITANNNRKIIYTSSLTIETKNYDDDVNTLNSLVTSSNGYYEGMSQDGSASDNDRYGSFVVRVPVANYSAFMDSVGSIGSVTYKSEQANDVTSEYVDVKARISSLNKKMERLEDLEEHAENVEDLLSIEDRINECQYQIENYTAQLNTLNDQIDYCTIDISINEVKTYTPQAEETYLSKVGRAFMGGITSFLSFISTIILAILYGLPFIIIIAVIILIVLKHNKKKAAKEQDRINEIFQNNDLEEKKDGE